FSLHFTPSPVDNTQKALESIFNIVPRIALGSVIAYIIGQHLDVLLFSLIKKVIHLNVDVLLFSLIKKVFSSDRTFIIRTYGSTILSNIVDTALFVIIAFL